ncbi:MAG: sugar phosphate isomerase/epimerase family protein [Ginsengibacter sp.]
MPTVNRREFINQTSTALLGFALAGNAVPFNKKYRPLLSFSTLGCPGWTFEQILNFADENGYDGIELRGILRQLDLTKCPEFNSKENILSTLNLIKQKKVKIIDLGSSASMHYAEPAARKKNLDEAKEFIQLAGQIGCPNIRLFPKDFPKDQEKNETIDLIVKGLQELAVYANNAGVTVLLITYGTAVDSTDTIEKIMRAVDHPNVGIGWDVASMWFATKESPVEVYKRLKKYIRIIHVKDLKLVNGEEQGALLGRGDTPIFETMDAMAKDGFNGYYSFEWEKYWQPDILEPEIALTDYAKVMKKHFKIK